MAGTFAKHVALGPLARVQTTCLTPLGAARARISDPYDRLQTSTRVGRVRTLFVETKELFSTGVNGLDEACKEGFARYVVGARPTLRRNAFVLVGDWFAADDLVQQTLIALYRSWERLERHDALCTYTRTVMVRLFIDERRRHRWTRELLQDSVPEPVPEPEDTTRVGDRLVLLKALSALSVRQRSLVYLRYWEDLSIEDVARIMDCSAATVRSSTSRALRILRDRLGGLGAPLREDGSG